MSTLVVDLRNFQRAYTSDGLWTDLDSLSLDNFWNWDGDKILFTRSCRISVFNPSTRIAQSITPGDDRHPKIEPRSFLTYLRQERGKIIPINEVGRLGPVKEEWMGIFQIPSRLQVIPTFPFTHWIEWGNSLRMNGRLASTQ